MWAALLAGWFVATLPASAANLQTDERAYWLPDYVAGVSRPVMSLNGEWEFRFTAQSDWTPIEVPGEAAMQGYAIRHDTPFYYRRTVRIPKDYRGKRVVLRFDGTYSKAQLYVNGTAVRKHAGGFTRWETDITPYVEAGADNELILELTDPLDDISYAAGYAHHPIGGILRDVTLYALPNDHVYNEVFITELDSLYHNAVLDFACQTTGGQDTKIRLSLWAPDGSKVGSLTGQSAEKGKETAMQMEVASPLKWDAEHPHLYRVQIELLKGNRVTARYTRQIGFRKIEIQGNRMLVNGRPVKLRGACRHDISPRMGRSVTAEIDSLDAVLFKEANMNFVRTSHYPPTERFVNFCDRYGIYVECETAACFVNTWRQKNYAPGASHEDPAYAGWYLSQCREMVNSLRNHPSILFWSIGNESTHGTNFQQCYDYVKGTDHTRPVIFSYPGSVPKEQKAYDLISMHYQDVNGNLDQWGMSSRGFQTLELPTIFDEWAHPACYTYATLQTDPNIREFWGQSLDIMWSGLFEAAGGLGGAIWGYVDETFSLPEPRIGESFWKEFAHTAKPEGFRGNCVGYGEWGIVDVWRRKKPEFWATKKAYSPVRLLTEREVAFTPGMPLTFVVYNRFDHTDLEEIKASYRYGATLREVSLPSVVSHAKGMLTIPGEAWKDGEVLTIEFRTADGQLLDTYCLTLGKESIHLPTARTNGTELKVAEDNTRLLIQGDGFEVPFDKASGLIVNATVNGQVWMEQGPFLNLYVNLNHLSGAEVRKMANHYEVLAADWKKTSFDWKQKTDGVYVHLKGTYRQVSVDYLLKIAPTGEVTIEYTVDGAPNGYLREAGLAFQLADKFDRLSWKRRGYWDCYPKDAMSGNEGTVPLYNASVPAYGQRPDGPWAMDTHNYYYWSDAGANCSSPLTQAAKAMKENIYFYSLLADGDSEQALSVLAPDASVACRLYKQDNGQLTLYANNRWDYPEIAWGNYCKQLPALPCFGRIILQLR